METKNMTIHKNYVSIEKDHGKKINGYTIGSCLWNWNIYGPLRRSFIQHRNVIN